MLVVLSSSTCLGAFLAEDSELGIREIKLVSHSKVLYEGNITYLLRREYSAPFSIRFDRRVRHVSTQ